MSVSLGCHVNGAVLPKPSHDPVSAGSGAIKRIATKPGRMPRKEKRLFSRFVRLFLKRWIPQIDPTDDISFGSWIDSAPYPESRREELNRVWEQGQFKLTDPLTVKPKYRASVYAVNNFIKDEFYDAFKHPRMINSRSDLFKCMVGPIFSAISKKLFGLKFPGKEYGPLIKYTPVNERPVVLHDLLFKTSGTYQVTDYSSFEAHFTAEMMKLVEFQLYRHCTQKLPIGPKFMDLCEDAFTGINQLHNKLFLILIEATRMSGEMNTSLGNGFFNMMVTLFLASRKQFASRNPVSMEEFIDNYPKYVQAVFEGDDGLATFHKSCQLTTEDYTNLGLIIKLEDHKELGTASFCGNLFDEIDLVQITNPLRVLATIGWSNRKYVRSNQRTKAALLRCKALSYLHQYPGCPIIQSLALWVIRSVKEDRQREDKMIDQMDQWKRMQTLQARSKTLTARKVPMRTRMLMEKLYGISPQDQLIVEKWFDTRDQIVPIDIPILANYWPETWKKNYNLHVMKYLDSEPIVTLNEFEKASSYVSYMTQFVPSMSQLHKLIKAK